MKKFLTFIFFTAFTVPAYAASLEEQAKAFIIQQQKQIVANIDLADDKTRFETLYDKIDEIFAIDDIYRFAAARYAKLLDDDRKEKVIEFFKKSLIFSYAIQSRVNTKNLTLKINSILTEDLPDGRKRMTLNSSVVDTQKTDLIQADFVLLYNNGKFLIYDAKVENISMLITFRNMFSSMMQSSNNDVNILMKSVEEKLAEIRRIIYKEPIPVVEQEIFILQ